MEIKAQVYFSNGRFFVINKELSLVGHGGTRKEAEDNFAQVVKDEIAFYAEKTEGELTGYMLDRWKFYKTLDGLVMEE